MQPSDFYTRDGANDGQKMPIVSPDGKKTKEWLMIAGTESDLYLKRKNEIWRSVALENIDKMTPEQEFEKINRPLVGSLVIGWSFEVKFSPKGIDDLLINAPYIREAVSAFAADKSNFLKKN